jgi:hypothetical protein
MSKRVISFRLSEREIRALDEACVRLSKSRSQVVSAGIAVLLNEYIEKDGTLLRRAPWFLTSVAGEDHGET